MALTSLGGGEKSIIEEVRRRCRSASIHAVVLASGTLNVAEVGPTVVGVGDGRGEGKEAALGVSGIG